MNRQFGALSGLAMVLIVLNHSIELGKIFPQQWGYPPVTGLGRFVLSFFQAFGPFAVPTFLFISGAFAAYAAQGDPPRLTRKFLYSTIKHILVPYIIWSFVFYALVYFTRDEAYTPFGYIKNLLVGYPYHFIPLLLFFYIISPLLVKFSKFNGLLLLFLIGFYQLILIIILNPGVLGFAFPEWAKYLTPPVIRGSFALWGIYYPLGLFYGLNSKQYQPKLKQYFWVFVIVTVIVAVLAFLDASGLIHLPIAFYVCPVTYVLLLPSIRRDSIPFVKQLERIGRRSYGIYLTHLIVLNLVLIGINLLAPVIFTLPIILFPSLFIIGLMVPLLVMDWSARGPIKRYYRYIFG